MARYRKIMRYITPLLLVLPLALSACSAQNTARQDLRAASYPALLPLGALEVEGVRDPTRAETPSTAEATVGELSERAEDMRRRAAALANAPLN